MLFMLVFVCSLLPVATCWERAEALVCDVYCVIVSFPCGILCQVLYLIVLISDLCRLSYF